jgi:epoxyqueuosine reductase
MTSKALRAYFLEKFDVVGIIKSQTYINEAIRMGKYAKDISYPTMVVLGLSYPKRIIKHTKTHLVPSFYTFGSDYHNVLKKRIEAVMEPLNMKYSLGVDNHPYDERLAAVLSGVGFFGKNQLIINKTYGTYMFLGIVFVDVELEEAFILDIDDDCGTCRKCISACPTHALYDGGYDMKKCISFYNQEKKDLTHEEMDANYQLFGCDICQLVCPKNIGKGTRIHNEFELSGKEMVSIMDLFELSNKAFSKKYDDMSYLWKGKTILLRNALMVMLKQKQTDYIKHIESSMDHSKPSWYLSTAAKVLQRLKETK